MNDLSFTKVLMESTDYRQRFVAEYWQTKIRYERLKDFCNKIEAARLMKKEEPIHDVPEKTLRDQQRAMGEYLHILEIRSIIEHIDLDIKSLEEKG